MIVIDASIALAWFLKEDHSDVALKVLDRVSIEGAIVPQLWRLEVANVLQMSIRRGRITTTFRDHVLLELAPMSIATDEHTLGQAWANTLLVADRHGLTVYDAAYFELALRLGLPIATLDKEIIAAARAEAVPVLP